MDALDQAFLLKTQFDMLKHVQGEERSESDTVTKDDQIEMITLTCAMMCAFIYGAADDQKHAVAIAMGVAAHIVEEAKRYDEVKAKKRRPQ